LPKAAQLSATGKEGAFNSRTLLRYRTSNITVEGAWVEGYGAPLENRLVDVSYWSAANSSWSFFQDFDYSLFNE